MNNVAGAISENLLPKHIAIVMDGNGRWAQKRMLPRVAGHHKGVESVRRVIKYCVEKNIETLTLFAFSRENWQRPAYEVKTLMALLNRVLVEEIKELHANDVCLMVIGDISSLSIPLRSAIIKAQDLTKNNNGLRLNVAVNYSGKWDLTQAIQRIVRDISHDTITSQQVNEELIDSYLSLSDLPAPDLFIRTSGEQRISNFLLWQLAYTELYFTNTLWPDFDEKSMAEALLWYATRQRRFGVVMQEVGTTVNAQN